ncbi:MAG TPA: CRTAC1 family protein [Lacunisphaera sp.]|nr:CRTAC1 family protein [Lacunisphaera sp.]
MTIHAGHFGRRLSDLFVAPRRRLGLLSVLAGLLLQAGEAQPPANPEFCAPSGAMTPEQQAQWDAALLREPASTQKMAALLQSIQREADPMRNPNRATEQIKIIRQLLAQTTGASQQAEIRNILVQQLLNSGRYTEALQETEVLEKWRRLLNPASDQPGQAQLLLIRALCYLRMGEEENCLYNHNAESCLFPIAGGGVHLVQTGSRAAVGVLADMLEKSPGDLRARWLLNIAYMTLGEYPAGVPPKWLIDPKCFASDYDIKRFPDVAHAAGLDMDDLAGGVVLEDFDNDGYLDLMTSAWGLNDRMWFFHNNGDGTFTDRTAAAGLVGEVGGLNLIHTDYNNDGYADVLVLRGGWLRTEGHYPMSLLRNNGDGTFTDVTEEAGLLTHFKPTQTAVWFDYNGDGWLDLFVGNESTGRDTVPCELFRNNGDGTFTECAAENGVDYVGFFKGVTSGDYDNDGRPDLYLSRQDGAKILLHNDGPAGDDHSPRARWKFTDVAEAAGVTEPPWSFPCWFFDYDNDGWLDIMVTGYGIQDVGDVAADYMGRPHAGNRAHLYHNNRDGTFTDVSRAMGLNKVLHAMGANFGDLDNDGWLDFYVGTGDPSFATLIPNRMFRNDGGRRFQEVTSSGGFGQLQKGHGIAFGDINNDGDQDIYISVGGAVEADHYPNQLFANPGHGNHWLKLKLEGVKTNRAAIGARLKVVVETTDGERAVYSTVSTGATFGSGPLRRELGLGQATRIDRVEIFWPVTGLTQVVTGLALDHFYRVREGEAQAVPVHVKSFPWPRTAGAPNTVALTSP